MRLNGHIFGRHCEGQHRIDPAAALRLVEENPFLEPIARCRRCRQRDLRAGGVSAAARDAAADGGGDRHKLCRARIRAEGERRRAVCAVRHGIFAGDDAVRAARCFKCAAVRDRCVAVDGAHRKGHKVVGQDKAHAV